ncbi:hypothetical protein BH10ACI1_BH10ACI1_08650 [soil metagenome]
MKKIMFCLALILFCSLFISGQSKSVNSNSTKKLTAEQSWEIFFPKFKAAVQNRDRKFIESVLPKVTHCSRFDCGRAEGSPKEIANLLFKKWNANKNKGWLNLKKTLEKGIFDSGTSFFSDDGTEFAGKSFNWYWDKTLCYGLTADFSFEGNWTFTGFYLMGCGH